MLERIDCESFWLRGPAFADELIWREAFEGLESFPEVVGVEEVSEVAAQLIVVVIVISASLQPLEKTAPSKPGIKHLVLPVPARGTWPVAKT